MLLCVGASFGALTFVLPSCSPSSGAPPALMGCVGRDGAPCSTGNGGGGGGGPTTTVDSGTTNADAGTEVGDAATCGTATEVLNAPNSQCAVCIDTSCCMVAAACTGPCLSILSCPAMSIDNCASTYAAGLSAYQDLASCISIQNCTSQCGTLPLPSNPDL